ncbi:hypothetical protein HaLaN_17308, partial [Haematococcus lacustris]
MGGSNMASLNASRQMMR